MVTIVKNTVLYNQGLLRQNLNGLTKIKKKGKYVRQ